MTIKSLVLKNFRAYKDIKIDFDSNMNVIIGQNDIGKSTILEALDIFFEGGVVNIEGNDLNKELDKGFIEIGVEFLIDNSKEIIIDTTYKTTPKKEFLLNQNDNLEIIKKWEIKNKKSKVGKPKIYLKSFYPKIDKNIVSFKNSDLKKELKELCSDAEYKEKNKGSNALIREAIYEKLGCYNESIEKELIEVDMEKDGGKDIWTSFIQNELPLYFLFQSDRTNKDSDGDIQNPLKTATKKIVSEFEKEFNNIRERLEEKLTQIGNDTIEKMEDMGLDIANSLIPKVNHKNLDTLFSFNLESDDGIPLNKRGSGFRRMVMLNYFRAEADRKLEEDKKEKNRKTIKNVIYAIEEPETAQHPNHQIMLIEALIKLSQKENHQIIITTHTPEIAKMVNENNLILVSRDETKNPIIVKNNEDKLKLISNTLGIHPFYNKKIVVCVEGEFDIKFIKNINQVISEYKNIIDLEKENITLIPLNGGNLKNWVDRNYLKDSNIIEIHIYDRDSNSGKNTEQYKKECSKIKNRKDKSYCFMTKKREMENYIHKSLIENRFEINLDEIEDYDIVDIPTYIQNKINNNLDEKAIKGILNGQLSKEITKEHLIELKAFDEIKGWFEKMKELSQ